MDSCDILLWKQQNIFTIITPHPPKKTEEIEAGEKT